MPFDRLVRVLDAWAGESGRTDVFAQIGPTDLVPQHLRWAGFLDPAQFDACIEQAHVVVGHAGTGTILSALVKGRPVLVMPRRAALKETRNDHQLATVRHMGELAGVTVAMDEQELRAQLARVDELEASLRLPDSASGALIEGLRAFLAQPVGRHRRT